MTFIVALLTGVSLSACTGLRAFLPPFLIGLLLRFDPSNVAGYALSLGFLTKTPVLIALGIAVVVEFSADKIPWVDHILDLIQGPVKVIISMVLTYPLLTNGGDFSWVALLLATVCGGGTGISVHAGKASIRTASTTTTGGLLNPVISVVEEAVAAAGTLLTIFLPVLSILLLMYLVYRIFRFLLGHSGGNEGPIAKTLPFYPLVSLVKMSIRITMGIYNRLSFEGSDQIPMQGPLVVVANHASMVDGFLLGTGIARPIHIMVKKEAFETPITGWLLRMGLAFPVDREKPDPTTIKYTFRLLQEGNALGLFPEGTRNFAGKVRPFKPGAIRIAVKLKVPIVPAFLANTNKFMPAGAWFPRPTHIRVKFGPPLDVAGMVEAGLTEDEIQRDLYERVCALGLELTGEDVRDLSREPLPEIFTHTPDVGISRNPPHEIFPSLVPISVREIPLPMVGQASPALAPTTAMENGTAPASGNSTTSTSDSAETL
ncbi:MAG: DUF4126 family protein [Candidatus Ozemobacteraceae bacterium]